MRRRIGLGDELKSGAILWTGSLFGVHPETASCGPYLRSRSFEILNVAGLRLRFQNRCGLDLNRNLPFPDGH
jgi:hypothetical protein